MPAIHRNRHRPPLSRHREILSQANSQLCVRRSRNSSCSREKISSDRAGTETSSIRVARKAVHRDVSEGALLLRMPVRHPASAGITGAMAALPSTAPSHARITPPMPFLRNFSRETSRADTGFGGGRRPSICGKSPARIRQEDEHALPCGLRLRSVPAPEESRPT